MKRRAVRLVLFFLVAAAFTAGGVLLKQAEETARVERASAREFDAAATSALSSLGAAQAALHATLAAGQSETFWRERTNDLLEQVRGDIERLKQRASTPDALNDLDAAVADVDALADAALRASRLTASDQLTQASRLIFGEGLERATAATTRIRAARDAHLRESDLAVDARRRAETATAAGLAIGCLLIVGWLAFGGRADDAAAVEPATRAGEASSADSDTLPQPAGDVPIAPAAAPPVEPPVSTMADAPAAGAPAGPSRDRRKAPELRAAADLCTDFARLLDSQELPALLGRAARLIDAAGLIVWVADSRASELRPALAHGYPARAVERMPSIPVSADNATAAAFRHAALQVVKTNGMSPGALVVPLLNASGCIGVVAAEVRHGRESSESARALARIIAAQLSGVLTVVPAAAADVPHDRESAVR